LIVHVPDSPVVLMHLAVFVAVGAAAIWTTAQLEVEQLNVFFPLTAATCTTGRLVEAQFQPLPGHRAPA